MIVYSIAASLGIKLSLQIFYPTKKMTTAGLKRSTYTQSFTQSGM